LPKLIGTKASRAITVKRGFIAADFAVRVFAPIALEAHGQKESAEKLRALAPIVGYATASVGKTAANAANAAANAAAYAAANAAAYAAANNACAAANAANAAANAANAAAAAARTKVYNLTIDCIEQMIAVQS
jgi:hypothetical protein